MYSSDHEGLSEDHRTEDHKDVHDQRTFDMKYSLVSHRQHYNTQARRKKISDQNLFSSRN